LIAPILNFQVGAADYIAIARNYHTIFISEIPAMSMKIRDKVFLHVLFFLFLSVCLGRENRWKETGM